LTSRRRSRSRGGILRRRSLSKQESNPGQHRIHRLSHRLHGKELKALPAVLDVFLARSAILFLSV
jgi:hypothetical protein